MPALWLTGLLSASLFVGIAWYLAPLSPSILSLQLAATPQTFGAIVHTWPPEYLARYRNHLPVDCLLLLAYGAFGYLLSSWTGTFAALCRSARLCATWALPVAALFDAVENALHWWLTDVPRFGVPAVYAVAACAAAIKWLLILAFTLAAGYALTKRTEA
jgi:hypothetical protein